MSAATPQPSRQECRSVSQRAAGAVLTGLPSAALPSAALRNSFGFGVFTTSYWRWRYVTAEARCS